MTNKLEHQNPAYSKTSRIAMKKLALLAMTALILGDASAHAENLRVNKKHQHLMSSHARLQEQETEVNRRDTAPGLIAPSTGFYGSNSAGRMDDQTAEGRTSGG
jgi:hypothetical protein